MHMNKYSIVGEIPTDLTIFIDYKICHSRIQLWFWMKSRSRSPGSILDDLFDRFKVWIPDSDILRSLYAIQTICPKANKGRESRYRDCAQWRPIQTESCKKVRVLHRHLFENFIQFFVKQEFLVLGTSFARIRNKNVAATLNKSHDPLKMLSVKAT